MTRRTAGALVGWGLFLAVASGVAIGFVRFGLDPVVATAIGLTIGTFFGVGFRHGVDRKWPRGITDPDDGDPEGDLGDIDAVLEICQRDREGAPATWGDLRPVGPDLDATTLMPLKKIPGYDRKHQAGVR